VRSNVSAAPRSTSSALFVRSTSPGAGGIATLILDGPDARQFLSPIFRCKRDVTAAESGALLFGRIVDENGRTIDEAIVAPIAKTDSPTGNEQFELSCHGGLGAIEAVEAALEEAGFSRGRDTELLERAHLNGKMSLIALETHLGLAHAPSARHAQALLDHPVFQERLERMGLDVGLGLRTEAPGWQDRMKTALQREFDNAEFTARLLRTHRVVLLGPVNAGKSSLANALAGAQRHLVSAIPGTTLDRLETPIELRGLSVLLNDTAGARETTDPLEREGQRRAVAAGKNAALRLIVIDGSRAADDSEMDWIAEQAKQPEPVLLVLSKADLGIQESARGLGFLTASEPVAVSVRTGEGLEALRAAIEVILVPATGQLGAFTTRQRSHLLELRQLLSSPESGVRVLDPLRKLIGSRRNPEELQRVLEEQP